MTKYAKVSTIKFLSHISYDPTICRDTRNPDSLQEVQINMQLMYSVDLGPTFDKSQTDWRLTQIDRSLLMTVECPRLS